VPDRPTADKPDLTAIPGAAEAMDTIRELSTDTETAYRVGALLSFNTDPLKGHRYAVLAAIYLSDDEHRALMHGFHQTLTMLGRPLDITPHALADLAAEQAAADQQGALTS
jgi:hypothetical protein